MEKIKFERGGVKETLLIPLYARKMCNSKFPSVYQDKFADEILEKIDYDFSEFDKKSNTFIYEFAVLECGMREFDISCEIKEYLKKHKNATIVNLGCGLSQILKSCDNGSCKMVNIDFEEIINLREKLLEIGEREENIACNLNDYTWMEKIDSTKGAIFIAAGVFQYFKKSEVSSLINTLASKHKGSVIVFDSVGKFGLKLMMKQLLKEVGMGKVDGYFSVNSNKDLEFAKHLKCSNKGYMLGYSDMKSSDIKRSFRIFSKFMDNVIKMKINKIEF